MDIKDLKLLIKTVTETDITEFKIENSEEKIVIKRGPKTEYINIANTTPQIYAPAQQSTPAPSSAPALTISTVATESAEGGETINSPIVGSFYRAPAPEAPPYVEIGQTIEKGQVLCIVEAMKLMNEIEAEFRCKIVKICKENAQAVEFGDPLFVIERV